MVVQIVIALFGFIAIYLTQQPNRRWQRYACIFGLISQPFFLYETFVAVQYGMFTLSVFYTYAWLMGFYTQWINAKPCPTNLEVERLQKLVASMSDEITELKKHTNPKWQEYSL